MMAFGLYWNLLGNFTLSRFYGDLAFVILQMVSPSFLSLSPSPSLLLPFSPLIFKFFLQLPMQQIEGRLGVVATNLRLRTDHTLCHNRDQLSLVCR